MKNENHANNGKRDDSKKSGTFIVKVEKTQNENWQGRVTWADENKSQHFRSTLELLMMIDNALQKSQTNEIIDRNDSVS